MTGWGRAKSSRAWRALARLNSLRCNSTKAVTGAAERCSRRSSVGLKRRTAGASRTHRTHRLRKGTNVMPEADLNARDLNLVQWLNEAYAKEAELEADLTAHIALTQKDSYKKRLRAHLTETRDHKRKVAARIKKLGGVATAGPHVPGVPGAVGEVAGKAVAAGKGQV